MYFGASYYPEHWPRERWEADAGWMQEAGFNVVRMAEFAWAKLEPSEGRYDFAWLDEAIGLFGRHGIRVVLGTPTAGPPAWLMDKHPDIYQQDAQGHVRGFGTRRHYCFNNENFHRYTAAIVRRMAEHYAGDERVAAWQIDNELGGIDTARCYCEDCSAAFRRWLQTKYGTLDALNEAWGTIFSSQTFSRWEHVHLPRYSVHQGHNPGLVLDFYRFSSDAVASYQRLQVEVLRQSCPSHPVTTNFMGSFNHVDYYQLAADLDFASLDTYPNLKKRVPAERAFRTAANLDAMRGYKRSNFWVMEHQSGPPGGGVMAPTPLPGELRRWTYQSIARGADGIVYFRWRTIPFGLEQLWHGILHHHGQPGRLYEETKQVGAELQRLAPYLEGTGVASSVAIVRCFDNEWAFEIQPHAEGHDYREQLMRYYRYFYEQSIPVDLVSPETAWTGYDLVILPNLMMTRPDVPDKIYDYVRSGGHVVMDFRAGAKEWNNRMLPQKLPGPFADLLGIEIEEYGVIAPDRPVRVRPVRRQAELECLREAQSGAARTEAVQSEAVRPEATWSEAAQSEATRTEAERPPEANWSEAARSEAERPPEATRSEAARSEADQPRIVASRAWRADTWFDAIALNGAVALAEYEDLYVAGTPAVTCNAFGDGKAYYIGTRLDETGLSDLLGDICRRRGIAPALPGLPPGVEAVRRSGPGKPDVWFVMNHGEGDASIELPGFYRDLLTGEDVSGAVRLPSQGVWALLAV